MLYGAEFFTGTEPFSQYPVGCEGCGIGAVHSSQDQVKTLTFGHVWVRVGYPPTGLLDHL